MSKFDSSTVRGRKLVADNLDKDLRKLKAKRVKLRESTGDMGLERRKHVLAATAQVDRRIRDLEDRLQEINAQLVSAWRSGASK